MGWTIWGRISVRGKRVSYSPKCLDLHPPPPHSAPFSMSIRGSFTGGEQLGRAAERWPAPSAKVKNERSYTSTPATCTCLQHKVMVNHRQHDDTWQPALLNTCLQCTTKCMYEIHFHCKCVTVALTNTVFIKENIDRQAKETVRSVHFACRNHEYSYCQTIIQPPQQTRVIPCTFIHHTSVNVIRQVLQSFQQ